VTLGQPAFAVTPPILKHVPKTRLWVGVAFCVALSLAAVVLASVGTEPIGIRRALQATGRLAFLLFWVAYSGGALATLFGPRFNAAARHRREFGLAFASAITVHFGLILWLYTISTQPPVSNTTLVFFATALFWTYLLAVLSIKRVAQALGGWCCKILRLVGLEYISFAFLSDFIPHPLHWDAKSLLGYLPFSILAVMGIVLRLAAWTRRNRWITRQASPS